MRLVARPKRNHKMTLTLADLHAEDLILFEAISGSHAYGLATPQSDTDIKGVFYLPHRLYYGLDYLPQISDAGNDTTYYELGRLAQNQVGSSHPHRPLPDEMVLPTEQLLPLSSPDLHDKLLLRPSDS